VGTEVLEFVRRRLARPETFGQLIIERRILITPKATISIPNIAVIATRTVSVPHKYVWNLALILLALGCVGVLAGLSQSSIAGAAVGATVLACGLVLARFFATSAAPCLAISSSDGHTWLFTGQRHTLEEARRLLSDKINADDETAVYRINFEKGAIQAPGLGPAEHSERTAGLGHVHPSDLFMHAPSPQPIHAPGPQLGNGHYTNGSAHHIDYAQILPQIVDMQRFYAQRQDTQDIADQLGELERLMRSGTPTTGSRNRLGQLTAELGALLGAYPNVVQIFQQAARLAGF
jgi:hypothetical protein